MDQLSNARAINPALIALQRGLSLMGSKANVCFYILNEIP